jgi:Flp pilus assembly protein TadB
MKLIDASILSVALALIVVGIHQTLVSGLGFSYTVFMFAVSLLFWFQLRRNKARENSEAAAKNPVKSKKPLKKR